MTSLNKNIQRFLKHIKIYFIYFKMCIIEVYFLKYYFKSQLIYKWRYYRQTIFNQLNIKVSYVYKLVYFILSQFYEKSIWCCLAKCYLRWLRFHFKRMIIKGLDKYTLFTSCNERSIYFGEFFVAWKFCIIIYQD